MYCSKKIFYHQFEIIFGLHFHYIFPNVEPIYQFLFLDVQRYVRFTINYRFAAKLLEMGSYYQWTGKFDKGIANK